MRLRHLAFVVTIWLLLVAGLVNARLRVVADVKLFDATPKPKPLRLRLSWPMIASGKFQAEVERRLAVTWGFRGTAIKTDNTINALGFGETRPGRTVVVGVDGWLFHTEDTSYINRGDACVACDALATRLGEVQRALLAQGRLVLPVVTAAKTTTERAMVPARWRRFDGAPPSDQHVYQRFVDALVRERVIFVDGRARLMALRAETNQPIFPRRARHWGFYAACLVYTDAINLAVRTLSVPLEPDDMPTCTPGMPGLQNEEDLGYVLNVWGITAPTPKFESPPPPPTRRDLRPVVIGTSFMWDFARLLRRSSFGTDARFYYYDDLIFDIALQQVTIKIDPNDAAWRAWTLDRNLYLIDLYEAYLPGAGYGPFLDQLEAALADRPYVATPR